MRNEINNFLNKVSDLKWNMKLCVRKISDKDYRTLLNKNARFKNLHQGKRCFIVGNGPSLKKMDLSKITNEITFTVNNIMYNKDVYDLVNSDYHIMIDPSYFNLNTDSIEGFEKIELLKTINYSNRAPVCFTSIEGVEFYKTHGLDKVLDLAYLYQHGNLTPAFIRENDLTRNILASQNVVQAAILVACYMGFKEIYLIGVDMTSIFLTFESNENGEKDILKDFHVYNYSSAERKKILDSSIVHDNEYMLYDYAKTFSIFKGIRKFAESKGINVYNATIGGGLDVFKRIRYESLFN